MTIAATKLTKRKEEELRLIANSTYDGILKTAATPEFSKESKKIAKRDGP